MSTKNINFPAASDPNQDQVNCGEQDSEESNSSTVYRGRRTPENPAGKKCEVQVNGEALPRRYDLLSASPSGYEWGYGGSGPAQLAIAILACECSDGIACNHYQQFNQEVVAKLPELRWKISGEEVKAFLNKNELPEAVSDG
jgi:hypothetical protein